MLKIVLLGVWVILVTAGATLGAANLYRVSGNSDVVDVENLGVEELKSEMTSVPLIRGGEIIGYLIIQLSFAAERRLLAEAKLEPAPYLTDATFRVIFARSDIDFRRMRGTDLDSLTAAIADEANRRLGYNLVRQVLIQQLNFVRREDIRTNWIGGGNENH
ncbi:hypothetical protein [Aestuariivirga sp.]|uniref:hypothetical protein n=1 Tax=Aestuariivirga sp. TaxID=2650926 RepID=UPI003592F559